MRWIALAAALSLPPVAASAQHAGHGQPVTSSSTADPQEEPATAPQPPDAGTDHSQMDHGQHDRPQVDHSQMDHSQHDRPQVDHSQMDHSRMGTLDSPREPIPSVTDADRLAAFPPLKDYHKHGTSLNSFWLMDQLEGANTDEGREIAWEGIGWVGSDLNRLWLRTKGHALDESLQRGRIEALYGRAIHPWWDAVVGVRRDFGDFGGGGTPRNWAAFGVQGLAPYKFEVSATGYVGEGGETAAIAEAEWFGQSDPEEVIGAGLSTVEGGVRLRYEITRQFAPYVGLEREWSFGKTSDLRGLSSHSRTDNRWVIGLRFWF
jgi:copper resistance protein B